MGEVSLFGEVSADESDHVFDRAFFPAMEGFAEKGLSTKSRVGDQVFGVFGAIIVGEGEAEFLGIRAKGAFEGVGEFASGFSGDSADAGITGFAFEGSDQGDEALMVADGVDFPVAWFFTAIDSWGPVFDRDSLGDVQFFMSSVMSFAPAFTVMTGQKGDQFPGIGIDPLVDGLRADSRGYFFLLSASGDLFGRPAFFQLIPNGLAQGFVFKSGPDMGFLPSELSPLLSPVGEIIPGFNGRGITFEFAGYGSGVSP
jgi:hypothetical protein